MPGPSSFPTKGHNQPRTESIIGSADPKPVTHVEEIDKDIEGIAAEFLSLLPSEKDEQGTTLVDDQEITKDLIHSLLGSLADFIVEERTKELVSNKKNITDDQKNSAKERAIGKVQKGYHDSAKLMKGLGHFVTAEHVSLNTEALEAHNFKAEDSTLSVNIDELLAGKDDSIKQFVLGMQKIPPGATKIINVLMSESRQETLKLFFLALITGEKQKVQKSTWGSMFGLGSKREVEMSADEILKELFPYPLDSLINPIIFDMAGKKPNDGCSRSEALTAIREYYINNITEMLQNRDSNTVKKSVVSQAEKFVNTVLPAILKEVPQFLERSKKLKPEQEAEALTMMIETVRTVYQNAAGLNPQKYSPQLQPAKQSSNVMSHRRALEHPVRHISFVSTQKLGYSHHEDTIEEMSEALEFHMVKELISSTLKTVVDFSYNALQKGPITNDKAYSQLLEGILGCECLVDGFPELDGKGSFDRRFLSQDADEKMGSLLSLIKSIPANHWFFDKKIQGQFEEFLLTLIRSENGKDADQLLTNMLPEGAKDVVTAAIVNIAQDISNKKLSRAEALVIIRDRVLKVERKESELVNPRFAVDIANVIVNNQEQKFEQAEALKIIRNRSSEIKKERLEAFVSDTMPILLKELPGFIEKLNKCESQQKEIELVVDLVRTLYKASRID